VAAIALDALDGHLARKKKMATPVGAQLDILGDRMIENVYFTYFGWWAWCRCGCRFVFCARGGDGFLARAGDEAGHSGWGANAMLRTWWGQRWWRRAGAEGCMRYEVSVLLLFGLGAGADARAGGAGGELAADYTP